jgi:hypothetical protein
MFKKVLWIIYFVYLIFHLLSGINSSVFTTIMTAMSYISILSALTDLFAIFSYTFRRYILPNQFWKYYGIGFIVLHVYGVYDAWRAFGSPIQVLWGMNSPEYQVVFGIIYATYIFITYVPIMYVLYKLASMKYNPIQINSNT